MTLEREQPHRLGEALRRSLARAGLSLREVERRLGWQDGTLSEISNGSCELRIKELLAILKVAGVEERAFFAELYELEPRCRTTSIQGEVPYSVGHLSNEDTSYPPTEEVLALFRSLVHGGARQNAPEPERLLSAKDLLGESNLLEDDVFEPDL